jgi:hypothetical protein
LRRVGHLDAEWKILRICVDVKLRLAPKRMVVVMMICAGKLGRRMFAHGMFAGDPVVGMHGVRTCGAMIRQSGGVTRQCGAPRAGCRSMTAQAATRAVATTTAPRVSAATTTARVSATPTARVSAAPTTATTARVSTTAATTTAAG